MRTNWRQAGMSLPEVMLGGAMVAGMALAGVAIFKSQSQSVKLVQVRSELDAFHSTLVKVVNDKASCNNNFASFITGAATTINSSTIGVNFKSSTGQIIATAGQKIQAKGHSFTLVSATLYDASGALNVTSVANEVKRGEIRVVYQLQSTLNGVKDVIKKIPVAFKFKAVGGFQGCMDAEAATKNTLQKELCDSLSASLVYYDAATDSCVRNNTSLTIKCLSTEVLIGLDANGNKICQSATSAFDESQAVDSTNATGCNTGTRITFAWDAGTNKIKVACLP